MEMPAAQSFQISSSPGLGSFDARSSAALKSDPASSSRCLHHKTATLEDDFSALYGTWFDEVLGWTSALGVRSCDEQDVAQSVFLVVYRRLPDCDRRNIGGWLYRITVNQVRDYRRLLWNRTFFIQTDPLLDRIPSPSPTPVALLETQETRSELARALSGLSEATKATFVLFDLQGFTCEEIASLHQVVPNTVWARLRRARRRVVHRLLKWRQTEQMAS
jgi:RNA polymerase sigma-70 factor (ECF subfamily)